MIANKKLAACLLLLLIASAMQNSNQAQELRRYQPSSPTVSPYLNLGRFNAGGLPNYYSLVRPLNRQQQINQQADRLQRQQSISLQQLQHEAMTRQLQVPQVRTGTASRFFNSGSRAVYRDTRQFYPAVNLRR